MKFFNVKKQSLQFGNRLVPSFYYYTQVLKEENTKLGIDYEPLENLCKVISDGEHSHIPRLKTGDVRYLYGRNIKEGIINFDPISDDPYITESDFKKFTRCHIKQDDVLISIYGTIGKSAVYKEEYVGKAGIPRHISNIRLKKESNITSEYLTAYFRSKVGKGQLFSVTTGNIQQLLSLKNIRKLDIPIADNLTLEEITNIEKRAIKLESDALSLIKEAKDYFYTITNLNSCGAKQVIEFSTSKNFIKENDLWTPQYSYPYYKSFITFLSTKYKIETLRKLVTVKKGDEVGSDNYTAYHEKHETDVAFIRTSDIVNFELDQYPDYFIDEGTYKTLNQDLRYKDILLTKDGKIGLTAIVGKNDKAIISSGVSRLRINDYAKKNGITPEYIFLILAINEIGLYGATKRSVVASTIPHLREDRLKDIEIPILDSDSIKKITQLILKAFEFKDERKLLARKTTELIDSYFIR